MGTSWTSSRRLRLFSSRDDLDELDEFGISYPNRDLSWMRIQLENRLELTRRVRVS